MTSASAPGKIILFGEHAVVYGRPALAVPVSQVRAEATVEPGPAGSGLWLDLLDLGECFRPADQPNQPLARLVQRLLADIATSNSIATSGARLESPSESSSLPSPVGAVPTGEGSGVRALSPNPEPDLIISVRSTIPIASGLGSGAAVATAIARALAAHLGQPQAPAEVSAAVYEAEKLYHGTPSGIDNTVIAFEQPVFFIRQPGGTVIEPFVAGAPFHLLIADSGVRSLTHATVGDVHQGWLAEPALYEDYFDRIGSIVESARQAIEAGQADELGPLMDANQSVLRELGVSSPELERLIAAARDSGASGAKLSGGGRGGNMIAFIQGETPEQLDQVAERVTAALQQAGAVRVLRMSVGSISTLGRLVEPVA